VSAVARQYIIPRKVTAVNDNSFAPEGANPDYARGFDAGKHWAADIDKGMIGFRKIKDLTFSEALRSSIKVRILLAYAGVCTGLLIGAVFHG
jgi:hypothetical protein